MPDLADFIMHEVRGKTQEEEYGKEKESEAIKTACQHEYGCRIICRLIEQFSKESIKTRKCRNCKKFPSRRIRFQSSFFWGLIKSFDDLVKHKYGMIPLRVLLECGDVAHKHIIATMLSKTRGEDVNNVNYPLSIATDIAGSSIMKSAILNCQPDDQIKLRKSLRTDDLATVERLNETEYGVYVVQALAEVGDANAVIVRTAESSRKRL
eukprot:3296543-Amphidinium_carterae.1